MSIGNNLMVSPPRTTTGVSVIAAARAAAEKTGDAKKDDKKDKRDDKDDKDDAKDGEKQQVAGKQDGGGNRSQKQGRSANEGDEDPDNKTKVGLDVNKDAVANDVAAVGETENPYVKKLFKDKSETQQVGWMYESLSPNSRNYANVVMPINTQVQVIVTQDMQTNSWNFSSGKAIGQIVINQNYR
jgi:hypothetical protein